MLASPSSSSSAFTFAAALSVIVSRGVSVLVMVTPILPGGERDLAGRAVDQGAELLDGGAADRLDEPLDEAAVQVAHELRVRLRELGEGAARERDDDAVVVGHRGIEADARELVDERGEAHRGAVVGVVELGHDGPGVDRSG